MKSIAGRNNSVQAIIALAGAILMIISLFLPYAVASDERAEFIDRYPDEVIYKGYDKTAKDLKNVSMVEFADIYSSLSEELFGYDWAGYIYVGFVVAIGSFSLLCAVLSFLKKPIGAIIFGLLSYGVFAMQNFDYTDRRVISESGDYVFGIAYYIFFASVVLVISGCVWMIVNKILAKKKATTEQASDI